MPSILPGVWVSPATSSTPAWFLAHKENDFVNGHNLVVDGGMTKRMIYVE